MLNSFLNHKKIYFVILGLFGLSNIVILYYSEEILSYLSISDNNTTLAEGDVCAPYNNLDYENMLKNQDEEVFTAGCGGLF